MHCTCPTWPSSVTQLLHTRALGPRAPSPFSARQADPGGLVGQADASFSSLPCCCPAKATNLTSGVTHGSRASLQRPRASARTTHRVCTSFVTQQSDYRYCSALRDEKEPVVVPHSKLQLWKEITKQCISCAFLLSIRIQQKNVKELNSQYICHHLFFGLALICSGDTQLAHVHHIPAAFRFFNTKVNGLKRKKNRGGKIVLSYEIRSISSVLLIKSYFNIKYSYSILYTSFSPLAEYCYRLVKQKNFNHFALQCFGGTIWFPAATLITVVGGKERRKDKG